MRFFNLSSSAWDLEAEPFLQITVGLRFGRNQSADAFFPVDGAVVKEIFVVPAYCSSDDENHYCSSVEEAIPWISSEITGDPEIRVEREWTLEDHSFKVVKTQKGTIKIVSGEDTTDRALIFLGQKAGFRGGCEILEEKTTATLLKKVGAGNALKGELQAAFIFAPGERVVISSYGRHTNNIAIHEWNGREIVTRHLSREEFEVLEENDGEVTEL